MGLFLSKQVACLLLHRLCRKKGITKKKNLFFFKARENQHLARKWITIHPTHSSFLFCGEKSRMNHTSKMESSLVEQPVKDPALSLQQPGLLPWHGFDPWPRNFHMLLPQTKINKF